MELLGPGLFGGGGGGGFAGRSGASLLWGSGGGGTGIGRSGCWGAGRGSIPLLSIFGPSTVSVGDGFIGVLGNLLIDTFIRREIISACPSFEFCIPVRQIQHPATYLVLARRLVLH